MTSSGSIAVSPAESLPARRPDRTRWTTLLFYSAGHFAVDVYSAALGVFQPLLAAQRGVTLSQAGMLGGMMVFAGSVLQPLWGILSDRFHSRLFSVLAPLVAAVFISSLGMATSFPVMLLLVFLGASGVASFHPQASARAAADMTGSRGKAMAIFISAGSLGFALGPTYFSLLLGKIGLDRGYLAAIPGVLVTVALLAVLHPKEATAEQRRQSMDWAPILAVLRPLLLLYMLVFLRSTVQISFTQFLPLYLTRERGFSYESASFALSMFSSMGAIGGFSGGFLADRFGGHRVIQASLIGAIPPLLLFFATDGALAMIGLALAGLILLSTTPINVVMAQRLAPGQSGTVSALMMGGSWGMAGMILLPLAGVFAERFTLHHVLASFALFPLLGFLLSLRLKKEPS
ncbi:MAG: MFS transporter [Bryobacterales bacterium]|nr:MFS transporter [Bryobacterales bacterium]